MGASDGSADDVSTLLCSHVSAYCVAGPACIRFHMCKIPAGHVGSFAAQRITFSSSALLQPISMMHYFPTSQCHAWCVVMQGCHKLDYNCEVTQLCCRGLPQQAQQPEDLAARQVPSCRCPRCGRLNYKQGNNNNLRCPFCTVNFCYLCKELLIARGSSGKHFGPKKACKQHSAD